MSDFSQANEDPDIPGPFCFQLKCVWGHNHLSDTIIILMRNKDGYFDAKKIR